MERSVLCDIEALAPRVPVVIVTASERVLAAVTREPMRGGVH
jgi:hypothetical protein